MNELKVSLENIIPLTYARDHFSQIVAEVQKDKLFVLTKGGKPAVAIIDAKYLETITGGQIQKADIKEEIKRAPEKVGLPPMVEHGASPAPKPIGPLPPPPPPKPAPVPPPPPKPAGFAAPQPPKPKEEPKPEPKPTPPPPPPKPAPVPPPPPKPVEKTPEKPPEKLSAAKPGELVMPAETQTSPATGIPNKPLTTLPPVQEKPEAGSQINVEFAPDQDSIIDQTPSGRSANADDKNPPAQYAGEKEEEPEDMALD